MSFLARAVACVKVARREVAGSRAMTLESTDGFVRVVARRDNHRIVGWQALGEVVQEAALRAQGHALHIEPEPGCRGGAPLA